MTLMGQKKEKVKRQGKIKVSEKLKKNGDDF